jgi:hypothetical protein
LQKYLAARKAKPSTPDAEEISGPVAATVHMLGWTGFRQQGSAVIILRAIRRYACNSILALGFKIPVLVRSDGKWSMAICA